MVKNIHLVVDGNCVDAYERGKQHLKGNIVAQPESRLMWFDKYPDGREQFVVKFQQDVKRGIYGWPFSCPTEPQNKELVVPANGSIETILHKDEANWLYEVSYPGKDTLDPMIIVREVGISSHSSPTHRSKGYAVGAIAFLAGTVVGMLLSRR
jgi:hypothetical protein